MKKVDIWTYFGYKTKQAYQDYLTKEFKKAFPKKIKYLKVKKRRRWKWEKLGSYMTLD